VTAPAAEYAERLLRSLGMDVSVRYAGDPVADWASSGAMSLTGCPGGPPVVAAGPAVALRGALLALGAVAPDVSLPGLGLLGERAAYTGHHRQGAVSCGGASRLLSTTDGTIAVTLARQADLDLVPALVEAEVDNPWQAVADWLGGRTSLTAAERLSLLGLPYGVVGEVVADLPWLVTECGDTRPTSDQPIVVNLGALWACPLAGSLLRLLGCRVIKVEDVRRPDGARQGPAGFFELLNQGVEQIQVDLTSASGRAAVADLLASADVVLEGSRTRALGQLGLAADDILPTKERVTWVSVTGHGRDQDRVGFGDDAAAAGGLVRDGCFVGDAIADPLTGVHAALAGWVGVLRGGSRVVDVPLSRVAATASALDTGDPRTAFEQDGAWWVAGSQGRVAVAEPTTRP
jgi:hypothetical protein